jgi:hypothetical protein
MTYRPSITALLFLLAANAFSQSRIQGTVLDENNKPVSYANVYIEGSVDGTSSDEEGKFTLETDCKGSITLIASFVGYKPYSVTSDISGLNNLTIKLKADLTNLKEIVVVAGNFQLKGGSNVEEKNAIDLVTVAGSEGDLYKSITNLPGAQISGTDGKLQVRGGSSHETQTYIDEMHVMSPYTSMPANTAVRGRHSTFIFDAINFSTGGFSSEYAQSLSGVLPLSTKDESPVTKTGASFTSVGLGTGGTKAWDKGSASFDVNYTNLEPYTKLIFPKEKPDWDKYYQGISAANQFRFKLGDKAYLKTYFTYDKTLFKKKETIPFSGIDRKLDFDEDNLYLNSTFKKRFKNGINYFAGAAYSWNKKNIDNARVPNDIFKSDEKELHLKTKAEKRFSGLYRLGIGVEALVKGYEITYRDEEKINRDVNHNIEGLFVSNDFNLSDRLLLSASSRVEYASLDKSLAILPRIALNYNIEKDIVVSAVAGKYQQTSPGDYLIYNNHLSQENTTQYMVSAHKSITNYRVFRVEAYYKKYNKLTTITDGSYYSDGRGYSRGIDLLYKDGFRTGNKQGLEYMLSYSFNDSERRYAEYGEKVIPPYVTKHNASVMLRYSNERLKSIIGVTNRFAGGRPYHDPNSQGVMNKTTPVYNSLDISWTVLAHKRLIIYASASNILGRDNIFGYNYNSRPDASGRYEAQPVKSYQKNFFFIGFFWTLSGKAAYDPATF